MPYMDLRDQDTFLHLIQLFLASHPEHRAKNLALRDYTDRPDEYFLNPAQAQAMAAWAREKHLITRKDAAHLVRTMDGIARPIEAVITLTPRVLGTPPRLQPSVLASALFRWLFPGVAVDPEDPEYELTVEAALAVLASHAEDAAYPGAVRQRAQDAVAWLAGQTGLRR